MISNWEKPLVSIVYTKVFQVFKWLPLGRRLLHCATIKPAHVACGVFFGGSDLHDSCGRGRRCPAWLYDPWRLTNVQLLCYSVLTTHWSSQWSSCVQAVIKLRLILAEVDLTIWWEKCLGVDKSPRHNIGYVCVCAVVCTHTVYTLSVYYQGR